LNNAACRGILSLKNGDGDENGRVMMMLMMGCHTITIIIISNENPFRFLLLYLSLLLLFSYNMHKASFHCTDIHLQVKKIHKRSSYNQGKLVTQLQFSSAF